jgi:FtsZ-binding cell division protein ZapB
MTEQLELNILRKQNCELACKIQSYRRQNRVLEAKNEELEAWTANFAAVISSL